MTDAIATPEVTTGETAAKKGAKKKPEFDINSALDANGNPIALDEDGRLTAIPHNWDLSFAQIGSRSFTNSDAGLIFEHKAFAVNLQIQKKEAQRDSLLQEAKEARTPLSESELKLRKLQKMQEKMAALEKELAAQGITV